MRNMILRGAYGRKYQSSKDALADWRKGKDFNIGWGGPYCSIRDLDVMANYGVDIVITIEGADPVTVYKAPADKLAGII